MNAPSSSTGLTSSAFSWDIAFSRLARQVEIGARAPLQHLARALKADGLSVLMTKFVHDEGLCWRLSVARTPGDIELYVTFFLQDAYAQFSVPGARLNVEFLHRDATRQAKADGVQPARDTFDFSSIAADVMAGPGKQLEPQQLLATARAFLRND